MYVYGLERLCASHRSVLERLKGRETLRIKSRERSASMTLLRWGVLGATETPAGLVVWREAIEVTPQQLWIIRRLIGSRDRSAGITVSDRLRTAVDDLLVSGALSEEWHVDGWKVHLRVSDRGLVLICRNSVYSFRQRSGF
ncbi:MAG: hypothetical protein JWP89_5185 [Schlesneria sp.]|nr:hypothetical protein [Schlesneria sp.]